MKKARIKDNKIQVYFPFDWKILEQVKTLEGRKFQSKGKFWTAPISLSNIKKLVKFGFKLSEELNLHLSQNIKSSLDKLSASEVMPIDVKLKKPLFEFQKEGVGFIEAKNGRALIADEMGLGKAQPWDTKVLTSTGWKQMIELDIKDSIFGSDGQLHSINGIYYKGIRPVYKVSFSDTSSVKCCKEHLWTVLTPNDRFLKKPGSVLSLKEIMGKELKSKNKSAGNKFFIPMLSAPINFPEQELELPPYLFGALLGDGNLAHGLGFSNTDSDVLGRVSNELEKLGYILNKVPGENCDYNICRINCEDKYGKNLIKSILKKYNLLVKSEYKFIPDIYKNNSVHQRLKLLRGIMDTDGYASIKSRVTQFTSVSEQLCNDVAFLVESLGGVARKSSHPTKFTYKGERRTGQVVHELTIAMPNKYNPFYCKRKRELHTPRKKYKPSRAIVKIEYVGNDYCFCISVNTSDKLYVTEHCILTHNTIQVIAWLRLRPEKLPVVIVVPASLKYNWKKEIETFMINPPSIQILNGSTIYKLTGKIIIINYDILPVWINALKRIQPKVIVTDEAHYYKNDKAKRTKAVKQLVKGIPHFLALSGTPIVNRPIEFYNVLKMLNPDLLPNRWQFALRYCGAKHNGFGWDFSGATNTKELFEKINRTVMIRRLKCNVLEDLPSKLYSFVPIPIDNYSEYKEAEDDFVAFIKRDVEKQVRQKYEENIPEDLRSIVEFNEGKLAVLKEEKASKVNILSQIEGLKQLAVKGKLNEAIQWIRNFLEVENKLVVFCTHKFVIQELENTFKDIMVKIDGSVSQGNRQYTVESFQNNPKIKLFVGNIKAAGIGITLTASSNVAFLELPWSPGDLTQAEDRCHRIGQKDTVNIHYLLSKGTIEEKIAKLLDKKRSVLDSVLDGKQTDEKSLLMELIQSI